ncbi:MAG: hypothetical protein ACRC46_03015 [Thermoguttaceae bacterium]
MRLAFLTLWILATAIVVGRVAFDVQTWLFGSTIVCRRDWVGGYDYLVHFPRGAFPTGKSPLILFLHGAGEIGKDVTHLKTCDIAFYAHEKILPRDFPFIVVSPVTPKHGWNAEKLRKLLDEVIGSDLGRFAVDPTRVYITGLSMGGFGTFEMACAMPEHVTAIAPICGGGDAAKAERLKSVPAWIFHGDADEVVPWTNSAEMVSAMKSVGCADVKFTTIPNGSHAIWQEVYSNPELYRWFLKYQRRSVRPLLVDSKALPSTKPQLVTMTPRWTATVLAQKTQTVLSRFVARNETLPNTRRLSSTTP